MALYVNVGGVQKQITALYTNVGGTQKVLSSFSVNIGGVSKELLESSTDYWYQSYIGSGTASSTAKKMVADSISVNSSGTFTLLNPVSITAKPTIGKYLVSMSKSASTATTGTTVYYIYDSSYHYRTYNLSGWNLYNITNPTSSLTGYTDNAFYLNGNLYFAKSVISTIYRWQYYSESYSDVTVNSSGIKAVPDYVYYSPTYISNAIVFNMGTYNAIQASTLDTGGASSLSGNWGWLNGLQSDSYIYYLNGEWTTTTHDIGYSKYIYKSSSGYSPTATYYYSINSSTYSGNNYRNKTTLT